MSRTDDVKFNVERSSDCETKLVSDSLIDFRRVTEQRYGKFV